MSTSKRVSDLKSNLENPRKVSGAKLRQLADAMDAFGDISGIVYNRTTQRLVGGTQRTRMVDKNAKVFVTKTFPKPTAKGTVAYGYILVKGERFNYREVEWDEEWEMAANIAANKGAGEFDEPRLVSWMQRLKKNPLIDMALTMHDMEELKPFEEIDVAAHTRTSVEGEEGEARVSIFEVVVVCQDEDEQRQAFEALTKKGYECRVLSM